MKNRMITSVFATLYFASFSLAFLQCHHEKTKAFTLDCSVLSSEWNNLRTPIDFGDVVNWDEIESIQLKNARIVTVNQLAFSEAKVLKSLDMSWNFIDELTTNQFDQLKNVRTLNFSRNSIKNIQRNALNGMDNLAELDLSDNSLYITSTSLLQLEYLTNLRILDVSRNTYLDLRSLTYGNNLKTLLMSENLMDIDKIELYNCKTIQRLSLRDIALSDIPNGFFDRCTSLVLLDLSQNTITSKNLQEDTFSKNKLLKNLHLCKNNLAILRNNLFSSNTQLELLDISYNEIKSIDPKLFSKNEKLVHLDLSNNKISTLQPKTFDSLVNLLHLDLSFNSLTTLENPFSYNRKLDYLNLKSNALKELRPNVLTNNVLLKKLDVSKNRLENFRIQSVANLNQLLFLYLGNNLLTSVPGDLLQLSSLIGLTISCNRLSSLPNQFFTVSGRKNIILYGNPWKCACIGDMLSNDVVEVDQVNFSDGSAPICYAGVSLHICNNVPLIKKDLDQWASTMKAYPNICK